MLLDKMIYPEHPLSKQLKDVSVNSYKPNWNNTKAKETKPIIEKTDKKDISNDDDFEEITFDNF